MKLTDLLDQIDRLDQQATKGPWESLGPNIEAADYAQEDVVSTDVDCSTYCYGGIGRGVQNARDAEFITLARTALPKLSEAVYHVLELLDATEKSTKSPSLVTTNEVRRAITDALEGDDE